ncbi:hypothetical protein [Brevundimonas sp. Root1423]|uniref:lipase/acyltransferase domain-containing protein n=1 Tax=Brevundimonas sp. Root1423 TaxID=1736462 RepID=UPI0012E3653D|nr:hypothetical protein [Brevundimonas sp. Root1423]
MEGITFVPGIMGCRLELDGEVVWPPTPAEAKLGYRRIAKLSDHRAVATGVIERVWCFPIYERVIADLGSIASGALGVPKAQFVPFHYDWRVDIREASAALADHLDGMIANGCTSLSVVAHSMGGLVARYFIESGQFEDRLSWPCVTRLMTVATPHRGAPVALVRALGLEGTSGLSGTDTKTLAANPRFPSLYQLFPERGLVIARQPMGGGLTAMDIYEDEVAATLQLSTENLRAAEELRAALGADRRPMHVAYTAVAATGHRTATGVDLRDGMAERAVQDGNAGDGAVPLWSSVLTDAIHHYAPGEHNKVLRERQFRNQLYTWFGAQLPAEGYTAADGRPAISVSVNQMSYRRGEEIDVLLTPAAPAERIQLELRLLEAEDPRRPPADAGRIGAVEWSGGVTHQLRVGLRAPDRAGAFLLTADGATHSTATDDDRAVFTVSEE